MKEGKNKYRLKVKIDPNGKPFKTIQFFELRARNEHKAETEFTRMFKYFSGSHGWGSGFEIINILG